MDLEKTDPLYTVVGKVDWCSSVENSMEVSQKIKNRTTIWLSNSTSGCISDKNKKSDLKRYMHPTVHSCIIYNSQTWEHPKCPSTHEWLKKWFIYTHTHTHTHNEILLSHKKGRNFCRLQQYRWTWGRHVKWNVRKR